MEAWIIWLLVAGGLIVLELLSGTFYLLMLATGPVAAALASHALPSQNAQMIVAAVVSILFALALYWWRGKQQKKAVNENPDVNLDIGQSLEITHWIDGVRTRSNYRGTQWDIELSGDARAAGPAVAGRYTIVAVRSNQLIVAPVV